jgi:hypothetical protein
MSPASIFFIPRREIYLAKMMLFNLFFWPSIAFSSPLPEYLPDQKYLDQIRKLNSNGGGNAFSSPLALNKNRLPVCSIVSLFIYPKS